MNAGRVFPPSRFDYFGPLLWETEPTAPGGGTYRIPAAICRNPISRRRVLNPVSTAASAFPAFLRSFDLPEPGELRRVARVYVWGRWFVLSIATFAWLYPLNVAEVVYGPNVALAILLLATNGYLHYRLSTERAVSWRWMLALSALDLAMLSGRRCGAPRVRVTLLRGVLPVPRHVRGGLRIGQAHSRLGHDGGGSSTQRSASRSSPGWTSQRMMRRYCS